MSILHALQPICQWGSHAAGGVCGGGGIAAIRGENVNGVLDGVALRRF